MANKAANKLDCNWDLRDLEVHSLSATLKTRFRYVPTNPDDCTVRVVYATVIGGELVQEMPQTQVRDSGTADCTGTSRTWEADTVIPAGYKVDVELWKNGSQQVTKRTEVKPE